MWKTRKTFFCRAKNPFAEWRNPVYQTAKVGANIIDIQANILDVWSEPYLEKFKNDLDVMVTPANGVLVPRLKKMEVSDFVRIDQRLKKSNFIEPGWVEPVYRYEYKYKEKTRSRLVLFSGTVTVRFKKTPDGGRLNNLEKKFNVDLVPKDRYQPDEEIRFQRTRESADPFELAHQLRGFADVKWAEADIVTQLIPSGMQCQPASAEEPKEPLYRNQWYMPRLQVPAAWGISTGKKEITVAVLDDGVDVDHGALKSNIAPKAWNVYDSPPNDNPRPNKGDGHGTAVAGIIAAAADKKMGVAGIAWKAKILPIRVSGGSRKWAGSRQIAAAIRYAKANGARIINFSAGLPDGFLVSAAVEEVSDACLVIASTGNDGSSVWFPASHSKCLGIGAIDMKDKLWPYSCYGPNEQVFLVAPSGNIDPPGGDVWTTQPGGYTGRFGGTSAAAPMVSGVAALVWLTFPHLSVAQVRDCLEKSAEIVDKNDPSWGGGNRSNKYGYGLVNAKEALLFAAKAPKAQVKPNPPDQEDSGASEANSGGTFGKGMDPVLAQLGAALRPSAEVVKGPAKTLELKPFPDKIVVRGPQGKIPRDSNFWKAVKWGEVPADLAEMEVGRVQGQALYLIPYAALESHAKLKEAALAGDLPLLLPAYHSQDNMWIPQGTITLKVNNLKSVAGAKQFAKKLHLRILETEETELTLELTRRSPCYNVFEAVRQLEKMAFTKWCEPDSFQPRR